MSRITMAAAAVAVMGMGGWYLSTPSANHTALGLPDPLIGAANAQESDPAIDTSSITEMQIGNPDAPVTVIEYASFTCPHCATFHGGTFKQLKSEFIDTDKINFIYREVYFDRYGLWASAIARCGGPDRFFGITDLIYKGQSEWARAGSAPEIVDELRKIGRLAGLDGEMLEACLQDGDKLRNLVAWYEENREEHNISSTPSFVINGTTYSNMSYDEMRSLIEEAGAS